MPARLNHSVGRNPECELVGGEQKRIYNARLNIRAGLAGLKQAIKHRKLLFLLPKYFQLTAHYYPK